MRKLTLLGITSKELKRMLIEREEGIRSFLLVDVREWSDWGESYIEGLDYLIPYSNFIYNIRKLQKYKDMEIVVYCSKGLKSRWCQESMRTMGFDNVLNLTGGIKEFNGLKHYQ